MNTHINSLPPIIQNNVISTLKEKFSELLSVDKKIAGIAVAAFLLLSLLRCGNK